MCMCVFSFPLAMFCGLQDLNSPTRNWTRVMEVIVLKPNHCTTREFLKDNHFKRYILNFENCILTQKYLWLTCFSALKSFYYYLSNGKIIHVISYLEKNRIHLMESGLKESAGGFGLNLGLLEMWICNSQICFFVPNPQDKQAQFFKVGSTVLFFFFESFIWLRHILMEI